MMIEFNAVTKLYKDKTALSSVTFEIKEGEIVTLLGHNGAGKTSIIKLICGLLSPDAGDIYIDGMNSHLEKNNRLISLVLEGGKNLYQYLSVYENIVYFAGINNIKINRRHPYMNTLIDGFKLRDYLDYPINKLSKGNAQKVSLVIALLKKPKILLLDEPTNGLDIAMSNELIRLITEISSTHHITTILTTHDFSFTEKLDCRLFVLKEGHLISNTLVSDIRDLFIDSHKYRLVIKKEHYSAPIDNSSVSITEKSDDIIITTYEAPIKDQLMSDYIIDSMQKYELTLEDMYVRMYEQ